eukprot:5059-Heterococcus_DN1.PRE.4
MSADTMRSSTRCDVCCAAVNKALAFDTIRTMCMLSLPLWLVLLTASGLHHPIIRARQRVTHITSVSTQATATKRKLRTAYSFNVRESSSTHARDSVCTQRATACEQHTSTSAPGMPVTSHNAGTSIMEHLHKVLIQGSRTAPQQHLMLKISIPDKTKESLVASACSVLCSFFNRATSCCRCIASSSVLNCSNATAVYAAALVRHCSWNAH